MSRAPLLAARHLAAFLRSLGVQRRAVLQRAPAQAAALWRDVLLAGEGINLPALVARAEPSRRSSPVALRGLGIHLVCPHHLTVAFGRAAVAYEPAGRIAGFGALSRLVSAATARFVLQETATQDIADALVDGLGARAAVAMLEVEHPCHRLSRPRDHAARALTIASTGAARSATALLALLQR